MLGLVLDHLHECVYHGRRIVLCMVAQLYTILRAHNWPVEDSFTVPPEARSTVALPLKMPCQCGEIARQQARRLLQGKPLRATQVEPALVEVQGGEGRSWKGENRIMAPRCGRRWMLVDKTTTSSLLNGCNQHTELQHCACFLPSVIEHHRVHFGPIPVHKRAEESARW